MIECSRPGAPIIVGIAVMTVVLAGPAAASDDPDRQTCVQSAPAGVECGAVEIVDTAGHPVSEARVTWWARDPGKGPTVGFWGLTDDCGRYFGKDLRWKYGFVEVEAPARQGDRCAGVTLRRWSWRAG